MGPKGQRGEMGQRGESGMMGPPGRPGAAGMNVRVISQVPLPLGMAAKKPIIKWMNCVYIGVYLYTSIRITLNLMKYIWRNLPGI